MIAPRYHYPIKGEVTFIGGTPDADMWFRRNIDILVVLIGAKDDEWGAYHIENGKITGAGDYDENDAAPKVRRLVAEKKAELENYIAIFAPWIVEKTRRETT